MACPCGYDIRTPLPIPQQGFLERTNTLYSLLPICLHLDFQYILVNLLEFNYGKKLVTFFTTLSQLSLGLCLHFISLADQNIKSFVYEGLAFIFVKLGGTLIQTFRVPVSSPRSQTMVAMVDPSIWLCSEGRIPEKGDTIYCKHFGQYILLITRITRKGTVCGTYYNLCLVRLMPNCNNRDNYLFGRPVGF